MTRRLCVLFCLTTLAGACAPVIKVSPPAYETVGIGIVQNVVSVDTGEGEETGGRVVVGFVTGGIVGALAAGNTEADLSRTTKWKYDVRFPEGVQSFLSNAVVNRNDCVRVERVPGTATNVLTRVNDFECVERPRKKNLNAAMIRSEHALAFRRTFRWALFPPLIALGLTSPAIAAEPGLTAKPVGIDDGDTFVIQFRSQGIDTPEKKQLCENAAGACYACGQDAKKALLKMIRFKDRRGRWCD